MTGVMKYVPFMLVTLLALLIASTAIQIVRSFQADRSQVTVYYCTPQCTLNGERPA